MLLVAALASFVVLASSVVADPSTTSKSPISVPVAKRVTKPFNPGQGDRERLRNLVKGVQRRDFSNSERIISNVHLNDIGFDYTANVGIGNPPTYYTLILDGSSANTWLGANKTYNKTSTSVETSNFFNISYDSGSVTVFGTEYRDTVTIAPGVVISQQSIGVASNVTRFPPLSDGILGLGPNDLSLDTLIPNNTKVIPTVTDNLFAQGVIEQNLIAVSLEPATPELDLNGEVSFGGTNHSKYTGEIKYFPRTKTPPTSRYWGVDASFRYGQSNASSTILNTTAGIFDVGYTQIGLAPYAYNNYAEATGAVFDNSTGFLRITQAQYKDLKPLFFEIGGVSYELNANAQIWPRALNTLFGGDKDAIYLVVTSIGDKPYEKNELGFALGILFLQRYYSVYDTTNSQVGLATTPFTFVDTN